MKVQADYMMSMDIKLKWYILDLTQDELTQS